MMVTSIRTYINIIPRNSNEVKWFFYKNSKECGIIEITKEQAKIIASVVAPDIRAYIDEHRVEYEAWLKEQNILKNEPSPNQMVRGNLIMEGNLCELEN